MADQVQLFINTQATAQIVFLPTFSNDLKDDNFAPAHWLQKVINPKTKAAWTDEQIITNIRNLFRGDLIDLVGQSFLSWY